MKRNKFSLSHFRLQSCSMGQLVPLTWYEVLPGDTIQQSSAALVRCAPLVTPVMHPIDVRFHTFFVPNRIMWTSGGDGGQGWESYITGGATGTDSQTHPNITLTPAVDTLADYFGLPFVAQTVDALPFRAYAMIWNEFFRDQDLQTALTVNTGTGNDTTTNQVLQNVCWEKDYYTTARPWEAKGPSISIPIAGAAPVAGIGFSGTISTINTNVTVRDSDNATPYAFSVPANQSGVNVRATSSTGSSTAPSVGLS